MKSIINKWQFEISCSDEAWKYRATGWKLITFGIFKIHTIPEEGTMLHKGLYKGFRISMLVFVPISFITF